MILDNFIIFLNVLEQFAIRVSIFDINVEDIIKYVNKLYFNDDDLIKKLIVDNSINLNSDLNPKLIIKNSLNLLDHEIINDNLFTRLEFNNANDNITKIY
jgi:hypothetical protein